MGIFDKFDFAALESQEFKEDSVREEIILPILSRLGYKSTGNLQIIRSKKLYHPYVQVGSQKKAIHHFPDYLLNISGKPYFVLDAKGPKEDILSGENVHQAYFYAVHPEIRTSHYGLCNGKLFTVFHVSSEKPVAVFNIVAIEESLDELATFLLPTPLSEEPSPKQVALDYLALNPLAEIPNVKKQLAKRHFGVHGYFTKQSWDVVQAYVNHFSRKGDVVLDPFGGTGVTAIEAMILGRRAIHIDLNPLSIFWVKTVLAPTSLIAISDAAAEIIDDFQKTRPKTSQEIEKALLAYALPKDISLPKGSDVPSLHQLFTKGQLAELALLRHLIQQ